MSAPGKRPRSFCVDPFVFFVSGSSGVDGAASRATRSSPTSSPQPQQPMTLRRIAYEEADTSLEDLRAVNVAPIATMPADAPLTPGTEVRLPFSLGARGCTYGLTFSVGQAEQELQDCDALLDTLSAAWEEEYGAHSLTALPPRSVSSPAEALLAVVHAEVARQLPSIKVGMQRRSLRDSQLPFLVDAGPVQAAEKEIENDFNSAVAELEAFGAGSEAVAVPAGSVLSANAITPATLHSRCDLSDDFCVEHTHRWEFAMHGMRTKDPHETWAVLSCQSLVALLDAVDCATVRDPLHTSRNAFFFIHDTFYVDDRHMGEADFEDMTAAIRTNHPLGAAAALDGTERHAFGRCAVKSAATTTFKDLDLKMGEYCLLRHCGGCDHHFFLAHVCSLRGLPRKERGEFPHRVSRVREQCRRCQLCRLFPSTVALYEDPLSCESPAYYCEACFNILHSADTPQEAAQYQRRDAKDFGETYFRV